MFKRNSSLAALVVIAISAVHGTASAGWLSDAMGVADLVAGGKKWNVITIESDVGVDTVTFLPAGKTVDDAAETLTFSAVVEDVPSSAYDAQAALDNSNNNDNTAHYASNVDARQRSVQARGLYIKVPGRTYSQLFSLKGAYMNDGKTFHGATYRVNILAKSKISNAPQDALDIMDARVAKISIKQIRDWFTYFHNKAKQKLAAKKQAETPKS